MTPDPSPADRRRAALQRISRIRRRVAAGTVALFLAAFLIVSVQLASGQDGALSATEKCRAATKKTTTTTTTGASEATTSSGSSSGESSGTSENTATSASTGTSESTASSSGTGSSESSAAEAVTTKQS